MTRPLMVILALSPVVLALVYGFLMMVPSVR